MIGIKSVSDVIKLLTPPGSMLSIVYGDNVMVRIL